MLSAILLSAGSVFSPGQSCIWEKEKREINNNGKKGTTRQPSRIYHDLGRMCHRLRQCMEISVDVRTKRGWRLYADLSDLPAHSRSACHDDGIFRRARCPDKSDLHVPEARKARPQMGDFRYRQSDWQYYPDGVLHRRVRLADLLLCEIYNRAESVLRLYTDDSESVRQCVLSAHHSHRRFSDSEL